MQSPTNILKYTIVVILVVAAILAVIFASSIQGVIQTSSAVQVPAAVNTAIQIGIIALLTAGFTWLFNVFGWDFRGLAPVIGLAIATVMIGELQNLINLIPAQFDPIVNAVLYFLTLILAPAGGLYLLSGKKEGSGSAKLI